MQTQSSSSIRGKKEINRRVYNHLNQIGWVNVQIILIENHSCQTKEELNARERHWIDTLKPELNKARPMITEEEKIEYAKIYHQNNYEAISERKKTYRQSNAAWINVKINCSCGGKYTHKNESQHMKTKMHLKKDPIPQPTQ